MPLRRLSRTLRGLGSAQGTWGCCPGPAAAPRCVVLTEFPPRRLAERYKECLTIKEKILKEIEVKKEYLSSLQPRLNSIMQVLPEPCGEGEALRGPGSAAGAVPSRPAWRQGVSGPG